MPMDGPTPRPRLGSRPTRAKASCAPAMPRPPPRSELARSRRRPCEEAAGNFPSSVLRTKTKRCATHAIGPDAP